MDLLSLGSKAPRAERACTLDALLTPHTCRGIENTLFLPSQNHKISRLRRAFGRGKGFFFLKRNFLAHNCPEEATFLGFFYFQKIGSVLPQSTAGNIPACVSNSKAIVLTQGNAVRLAFVQILQLFFTPAFQQIR